MMKILIFDKTNEVAKRLCHPDNLTADMVINEKDDNTFGVLKNKLSNNFADIDIDQVNSILSKYQKADVVLVGEINNLKITTK